MSATICTTKSESLRDLPELAKTDAVGACLGCTERHVRRLCESGDLPAIRIGRYWRVKRDALIQQLGL